jgi:Ca2+-binding RTX toxin-like protein
MPISTPTTDGGHVETWVDALSGPNILHAQKYDAAGQKVGGELDLTYRVVGPYDVAALAGGGYAIVYTAASPGGSWGQISIQGGDGAVIAQSSTAAGFDFHIAAGADGGFLVTFAGIPSDSALDGATPLVELYDAAGHSLNTGHIQLAGQIESVSQSNGVFSVAWDDGGVTRTLTLDPHTAAGLTTPAKPTVQVIDNAGASTGVVANGGTTDDATPTFHIAVTQPGEVFVELDKGTAHYDNLGGGIAVTDADVARGYVEVTLPTSGDGHYYAFVRVADASGSASYPVTADFVLQSPPPASSSSGQTLSGSGTVQGGSGDDTIASDGGTTYLRGNDGNDSIQGGAGFDDINGNKGNDVIDGGSGGSDWLVGGQGDDQITAHASGNILYGNLGNDTLAGGSDREILRGGQGDDVISAGGGDDWISGDRGDDTVTGGAGADTFHAFSGSGLDVVTDFNFAEGDRVQLDPGTAYAVSQVGADVVVDMGSGDQLVLQHVQLSTLAAGWITA